MDSPVANPDALPPGAVADLSHIETRASTVAVPDGELPVFVATPKTGPVAQGVLVIHDGAGLTSHAEDICTRFANVGYAALAPDLYWRVGAPEDASPPAMRAQMFQLDDRDVVADLAACCDHMRQELGSQAVATIGFCMGGRFAVLLACQGGLDLAISCWGGFVTTADGEHESTPLRPVRPIDAITGLDCPLLIAIGEEDTNPSPADGEALRAAAPSDVPVELAVYPDAGHAFFADYRSNYRPKPARQLWEDVLGFLDRHLTAGEVPS